MNHLENLKDSMPNLHSASVSEKELFVSDSPPSPAIVEAKNAIEEKKRIELFGNALDREENTDRVIDFSAFTFRCSSLGKLMTGVNYGGITEKQQETLNELREKMRTGKITDNQLITLGSLIEKKNARPSLSATAKNYLELLHKEEVFNRRKEIISKYLDKGIQVEEQSISLYTEVYNKLLLKNKERFTNEFITGEPDNIQDVVRDFKSSWDFSTFPLYADEVPTKDYYWQLQGYMELTGLEQAELIYCLVDTPAELIEDEKRRTSWKLGHIELPEKLEREIESNMIYQNIPKSMRVKVFTIFKNPNEIKAMYEIIKLARKYLNSLSVQLSKNI